MKKHDIEQILAATVQQIAEAERELDWIQHSLGETELADLQMRDGGDRGAVIGTQDVHSINHGRINGRLPFLCERRDLLEKALREKATFPGTCEVCGDLIGKERFLLSPETDCCATCQAKKEG